MNIEYFRHFVEIVNEGTILKASKKLFVSQPSLTNEIKFLEKEYDIELFNRKGKKMSLTDSGKLFYEESKKIIGNYDNLKIKMQETIDGKSGFLKIAVPPSIYHSMLQNCFQKFIEKYPDVKLEIFESSTKQVEERLLNETVSLAITNASITKSNLFDFLIIADESLKVYVDKNSELSKKEQIEISDLSNQKICIPRAYFTFLSEICNEKKVKFLDYLLTTTSIGCVEFARLKNYIAIAPFPENESILSSNMVEKRFNIESNLTLKRKLVWKKGIYLSKTEKNFIEIFAPNYFA